MYNSFIIQWGALCATDSIHYILGSTFSGQSINGKCSLVTGTLSIYQACRMHSKTFYHLKEFYQITALKKLPNTKHTATIWGQVIVLLSKVLLL